MRHRYLLPALILVVTSLGCSLFNLRVTQTSGPPSRTEATPADVVLPSIIGTVTTPLCTDPQPAFITGFNVFQIQSLQEPAARIPFRDAVFGSCVVRVTDRFSDISPGDPSKGMMNEYSRVQSFNADGSRILVRGIEATWYLYDAQTLLPLSELPIEVEPRWSPTDPNLIYYTNETRLMSYDIQSRAQVTVHEFASDLPGQRLSAVWTPYEGSPSADGRYWGLMAEDEDWLTTTYLIYDLQADKVIATRDIQSWPAEAREIDAVTISPLGDYFLAYMDTYCEACQLGTDADPCGLMVYDRELKNGRGVLRIIGHTDLALDAGGREVMIYQDIDTDHISLLDLGSGTITALFPIDFSHAPLGFHFSGGAYHLPGWAVVSTYAGARPSATWMDDQVFAIELKAGGRIVRLAHTHSVYDENIEQDYWAEPHASVNRDLTRILFTSNWGRTGTEEVEMFMIQLPANWLEQVP